MNDVRTNEDSSEEVTEEELERLYGAVIAMVEYAIGQLYHLPLPELRIADPSMQDIANLCRMFHDLVEKTGLKYDIREAVDVVGEAAEAITDGDHSRIIDCASHLEDFLERQKK